MKTVEQARSYIQKIVNPEKRAYANAYMNYLEGKQPHAPLGDAYRCSLMARQAVRLALIKILGDR
jgi:hypothetical protein